MKPRIIGPDLFAKDAQESGLSRIATIFPHDNVIVTVPTIHLFQQEAYFDVQDRERRAKGAAPLTAAERKAQQARAVSLFVVDGSVQIRPDPNNMPLIFAADAVLQKLLPKSRIRFLNALDARVRDAVKARGMLADYAPAQAHL